MPSLWMAPEAIDTQVPGETDCYICGKKTLCIELEEGVEYEQVQIDICEGCLRALLNCFSKESK